MLKALLFMIKLSNDTQERGLFYVFRFLKLIISVYLRRKRHYSAAKPCRLTFLPGKMKTNSSYWIKMSHTFLLLLFHILTESFRWIR